MTEKSQSVTTRGAVGLRALNFFMADMQSGIGPFVGVYLLAHGWQNGLIGSVVTIGSIAGVLVLVPAGAWVDHSSNKRWIVVVSGLAAVCASSIILLSQTFWPVAVSQVATTIAGAAVGPAVTGITLGMYRQTGFNRQLGVNQAYNHAGNAAGAALSGLLGWKFGLPAVLWLALAFGVISLFCVLVIPSQQIDDRVARGLRSNDRSERRSSSFSILISCKPLMLLAATLAVFYLGNGAMISLYALAVVTAKQGDPAVFVATTVVVAQLTMVGAALLAARLVDKYGAWLVILASFVVLPVRVLLAPHLIVGWGVFPMQILDGVTSGLHTVAIPVLVARILNGTGRINLGQGAIVTAQAVGAAFSPAIGGWMADWKGYNAAFYTLGAFAIVAILLWTTLAPSLKPMRTLAAVRHTSSRRRSRVCA